MTDTPAAPLRTIRHQHGQHGPHDHTAQEYADHQQPIDGEEVISREHGPASLTGVPDADIPDLSDGYHTMSELYDHRCALTAVLCTIGAIGGDSWRSKAHHPDDGPMFDGYFIVGLELPAGTITYHYPEADWERFAAVQVLEHAPKWDGHDSAVVVDRLLDFSRHLHRASLELGAGTLSFTPEADPQGQVSIDVHPDERLGAVPDDEPEETPEEQAAR